MKINNSLEAGKYRLYFLLSIILVLISVFFMIFDRVDIANIIIFILGVLAAGYIIYKNPYFIQFETTHKEVIFKYYSVFPFFRRPKVIKIPLSNLEKYKIDNKKSKPRIFLYIKTGKKVGKYPPISFSIVPNQMLREIRKELDYLLKVKNFK